MEDFRITISRGLLQQLAGIKREPAFKPPPPPTPQISKVRKETLEAIKQDQDIRAALGRAKRVGDLLLKREEEERRKVDEMASRMLQREHRPPRGVPCEEEKSRCLTCYQERTPELAFQCSKYVDEYARCAEKVLGEVVTKS